MKKIRHSKHLHLLHNMYIKDNQRIRNEVLRQRSKNSKHTDILIESNKVQLHNQNNGKGQKNNQHGRSRSQHVTREQEQEEAIQAGSIVIKS